ncbi:hypothetical protein UFOVP273_71 [uncultured Caudovirales phage]|uniref:Uncharacterized protein n=1 Tax=uncultured Caudovirales phage TaxID=2100421 RepID=A0A6J5LJT3_9CAUD|nr:hypothetical protein UFOVP273_71 [uncultured Caudovirales phage]
MPFRVRVPGGVPKYMTSTFIKVTDIVEFRLTCMACPEQYDVYLGDKEIGYVRLRWGHLRVNYPDFMGKEVYSEQVGHEFCGEFHDDHMRRRYLKRIARILLTEHSKNENLS